MEKTKTSHLLFHPFVRTLLRLALVLLCLFLTLGSFAMGLDPNDCRILENVHIGSIDVGGMAMPEALRAVKDTMQPLWDTQNLILELPEETLALRAGDAHISLRYWDAVWNAYRYGRMGNPAQGSFYSVPLRPYLKANVDYLRGILEEYAARHDTDCTPYNYQLEGTVPNLSEKSPACQTLKLTMGLPTQRLDVDGSLEKILTAYAGSNFTVRDFPVDILETPETPDLSAIYDEYYVPPVDDALDMQTYQVIPGSYGYHFDLDTARKLVKKAQYGQTLSIPMVLIQPEITGDAVYFRDVLGSCQTPHTQDANRNHNLTLACQSMDGVILQPGEVFSYNDTLGQRTPERGYRRAGAYSGWELVQAYGGGICQGSSTIYGAALSADLEIVQRRNHGYMVGYVQPGLDATVNWGSPDFQFRNNTHFPIQIAAEVSDGFVKVTILGTEERDYYVKMESEAVWGDETIYAKTYRCKYDRQTDALLSRELETRSNYAR